jgi:molybdenum cofactor synthesis domain-containing protein
MSEVRAGIVVTGTEVLTGRIADKNGPWISERLAELGVDVAHILIVGDRPDDLEAALRFLAAEGMDLIVTSGGLGPTADDLTAEIVARFVGREMVLDEEMEAKIAEILRGFARRFNFDEEAVMESNRKQAMVPEGSIALDPVGTAPGLVVRGEGTVAIVLPGPPRELQPMWPVATAAEPVREVLSRATPLRGYTLRMFGVPESEIAKSLREIEAEGTELGAVEITTCLRRGEIEIDVRYRDQAAATADAVRAGLGERHRRHLFSESGETIDEQVAQLLAGHRLGLAESCSEVGAARRRFGADRGEGRRLTRGCRGDGDRGAGAFRRRHRRLDHGHRRPRRWHRGEAGRLRLLQRPPRRRHRDSPRSDYSRWPRRYSRPLRPGRHAPAADPSQRRRAAALVAAFGNTAKRFGTCLRNGR